jgi:pimeloyl-ACP methyl ester carboxylesterase
VSKKKRSDAQDLRAATRLLVDATTGVTGVVEQMHRAIAAGPRVLGAPLAQPARLLTGLVYGTVRGVTKLVGAGVDQVLAQLEPLLDERTPGPARQALVAALNGVLGDVLEQTGNPLAVRMQFRRDGAPFNPAPATTSRLLVLVHGSSMNDLQWARLGHEHGAALSGALGFTPVYLLYNTGLHVSTNGRELAQLLEALVEHWPTRVTEVVLLGHSMGGLVVRSACEVAQTEGLAWRRTLRALVCLGTPHHGAPLERGGAWVDFLLGVSPASAPLRQLARVRSAGVTDLRFGNVRDEDWQGTDRFTPGTDRRVPLPLPTDVACFAVAASRSSASSSRAAGDGLVPVASALGRHADPARQLTFSPEHQRVVWGASHLDLLSRAEVYEALRGWLA